MLGCCVKRRRPTATVLYTLFLIIWVIVVNFITVVNVIKSPKTQTVNEGNVSSSSIFSLLFSYQVFKSRMLDKYTQNARLQNIFFCMQTNSTGRFWWKRLDLKYLIDCKTSKKCRETFQVEVKIAWVCKLSYYLLRREEELFSGMSEA